MLTLLRNIWRIAVHPVTFVVLCLLWCLDLGLGSLLAYERPDIFGAMDAYPFALCTVNWFWRRRRSLRGLGEVLVHLGFLLVFGGFVVEATLGTRVHGVQIPEGGQVAIRQLGITLRLERVELTRSPEGEVLDTVSTLAVGEGGSSLTGTSRLNHPLIAGATVVYPRGSQEVATRRGPLIVCRYDVHRDPGVRFVLAGAVLLFAGTLWAFVTYLAAPRLAPPAPTVSSSAP